MTKNTARLGRTARLGVALLAAALLGGTIAPSAAADTISCSAGRSTASASVSSRDFANGNLCLVNGRYKAVHQSDGNFVVYRSSTATWNSGTSGRGAQKISLQGDSNLVVYGGGGALWASNTSAGNRWNSTTLAMQSDGNLVLYGNGDGRSTALWWTGTN
ncbi:MULTISPECIES: hypothetical protein [unclassified Rathayibacter]|uniref:hypothetical protein n=1 Tax=unclassified Rathayibacter TaxID=2609250 RepID=UPI0006F71980|nr:MULTISPECIES: hypothetical protein [unclassified Rathayibacter]KQQ00047.1 hypothetical protein ASF42_16840 [Rathayibacter sp. Leaf294]KQS09501.1 hypothetical protein ASG06_16840 [Rathayibacter sp. Leaf185]